MTVAIGKREVIDAVRILQGRIVRTPALRSTGLDGLGGAAVTVKAESLQHTGSFKVRGALNRINNFSATEREAGLLTVSAGNAALGAAFAAREYGCPLTVIMPAKAVKEKLHAVAQLGATVVTEGITDAAAAFARADQLVCSQGLTFVHPFDDPFVVAGAATATLELLEDAPDLQRLFVPCSGGGLLAGAIVATTTFADNVEVIGVQPSGAAGFVSSLAAGRPTIPGLIQTVADGLTAPMPGKLNYDIVVASGISIMTVDDQQILQAMRTAARTLRLVVEPAGATGLAGLLATCPSDRDSGTVLSGSNVNWELLAETLTRR